LPAKTIFAGTVFSAEKPVFTGHWQKLANPDYAAFNTPCVGHKDDESQAHIIHIHTKSKNSTLRGIRNIGSAVWAVWRQ